MTEKHLNAQDVADFLAAHPEFFDEHAEVFHGMKVAHPNGSATISLAQRQVVDLRRRVQQLEEHIRQLSVYALQSQELGEVLTDWCVALLAEHEVQRLPQITRDYLNQAFPELEVSLRLWGNLPKGDFYCEDEQVQDLVAQMQRVYTGNACPEVMKSWFDSPPASAAVLPLRKKDGCFGVLVFGSPESDHFTEDMAHTFLVMVSALCSAALSRLSAEKDNSGASQ